MEEQGGVEFDGQGQFQPAGEQPPQFRPQYDPSDQIERYGSIIKDLTDTEKMLTEFELKLKGRELDDDGKEKDIEGEDAYMTKKAAREFISIIRSIVNQNTHFTRFKEKVVYNVLMAANYHINRFLMIQGKDVPLRYRGKISFEAMNLINASLHKANEGTILRWTKGTFRDASNMSDGIGEEGKKSMLDWLPFRRRK